MANDDDNSILITTVAALAVAGIGYGLYRSRKGASSERSPGVPFPEDGSGDTQQQAPPPPDRKSVV